MERMKKIGKLPMLSSNEIQFSRIGIGFEKLDREAFDPELVYDSLAKAGPKKTRIQSGWARTEKEKGIYDFSWLDSIVDNLISRGMEPWMCLCYGNPIYNEEAKKVFGGVGCAPISNEEEKNAWIRYVKEIVSRYKGKIEFFEIWNEPDCFYAWRHNSDIDAKKDHERHIKNATEYGRFAIDTSIAIKEANENAKVMGFSHGNAWDLEWTYYALETGLGEYIDYASFHMYTSDERLRREYAHRFKLLVERYNPKIKIIQGETGSPSTSKGEGAMMGFAWTQERQAKALLRGMIEDLAEGVEFTSYFTAVDVLGAHNIKEGDVLGIDDYEFFGILERTVDENGKASENVYEKASYYAFANLVSLLHGNIKSIDMPYRRLVLPSQRVNGTDCEETSVIIEGFELDNGKKAMIYWNCVDVLTRTYEGTISFEIYDINNEDVKLINLMDGTIYEIPENLTEKIGKSGIKLINLPITDSPIALVF